MNNRAARGGVAQVAGRLAEDAVCRRYVETGCRLLDRRWRGEAGEVDLIFAQDDAILFVEVKAARTHQSAATRILPRQMARIALAAEEYCAHLPDGQLTEMRIDVALVDATGRVEVVQNAFGSF